jgi:predicted nucleotidyltransferase
MRKTTDHGLCTLLYISPVNCDNIFVNKALDNAIRQSRLPGDLIGEVVRRIVDAVQPEKIVLFGSVARGETKPGSDLDVLVVKQCVRRRELAGEIYKRLIGVGVPVDVVVATPSDLERYGSSPAMVLEPALREGRVVYAA